MSGRKLGGGRILGSGKGLAPPLPGHPPRASSPFAPSESSTASLRSPSSASPPLSSPLPDSSQDLASQVSLGHSTNGSASSTKLVCPICEEEMLTLLQLNRHIDDTHQELPEADQDEIKTWFDKQVSKAKRFQPLSIINQKLRGLDVFESNVSQPIAAAPSSISSRPDTVIDPEELVTRKHWQRTTGNDVCTDPLCARPLGPITGSVNCRKCGRLFCEEHTMYQMKLSRAAHHEPVRGYWCRVCETCYKSREGYNDHNGLLRNHSDAFLSIRRKRAERQNLEISRLEKRLTRLTTLLASPLQEGTIINQRGGGGSGDSSTGGELPAAGAASGLLSPVASLTGARNQRKLIEQSVVAWEDDASVLKCPFCQQEFGSWTFRRHHCRICGRVVCADPQTNCSNEIGLNVANRKQLTLELSVSPPLPSLRHGTLTIIAMTPPSEKQAPAAEAQLSIDVRMCRDCKGTLFSKRDFAASIAHKPPDQRAYETLRQFERGIQLLLPSFQRALLALQSVDGDMGQPSRSPPTRTQIQEAAKFRKRLIDSFTKYDLAARRIRDMKSDSPTQLRLQKAIYAAASSFLHTYMLPLKSVPRILNSHSSNSRRLLSGVGAANGSTHLSPLRNGESVSSVGDADTASLGGTSETSTAASALELEEKEVREKLVVLEEQRFLVQDMVNNARGARRFEEVSALSRNLEELDREIGGLKKQVSGVEERWEGLYASGDV